VLWYRKAAQQGHEFACYSLGKMYESGRGVAVNINEAIAWYRKAADKGVAPAQYALGQCYAQGTGVVQNWEEAVKWYTAAIVKEYPDALRALGWCYQNGKFTAAGLDETIERNVPFLMQATGYTQEEAVSFLGAVMPTLKHWRDVQNSNVAANLRRSKLYVCPDCGNVVWSAGEVAVRCCSNVLEPLAPVENDGVLDATVEHADGVQRVRIIHPMAKDDHLMFIAAVGDDLVRIKRLYPEQEARAEFPLQGRCKIYAYGKSCGLIEL
jgi:hypothetical protein